MRRPLDLRMTHPSMHDSSPPFDCRYFTSFERILEYRSLPQEPPHHLPSDPPAWPSGGDIKFENASMRYRSDLKLAVEDLTMHIPAGTKVGVVGRTGAGKSSLAAMCVSLWV